MEKVFRKIFGEYMVNFLPAPLRGSIAVLLYLISILFWSFAFFTAFILSWIPVTKWRDTCRWFMNETPKLWTDWNDFIGKLINKIEWEVHGIESLKSDDWYLIISNHQSATDILIVHSIFNHKIPIPKFFMKKQLLWTFPFASWGCWLLNYPFMERYSKEFLIKHPHLKGKDLETTRKACKKFKDIPTSVISFVEGTRFTQKKHDHQRSPYKHLLRPRAGGFAYTMSALEEYLHKILNVTIIYANNNSSLWAFCCGTTKKIIVHVESFPVTQDLLGDYENDKHYRAHFHNWLNELWQKKDELIDQTLMAHYGYIGKQQASRQSFADK